MGAFHPACGHGRGGHGDDNLRGAAVETLTLNPISATDACHGLQHVIMGVVVTATTTSGAPLAEEALGRVLAGADLVLALDADKAAILELVQQRMHQIAPNLSRAVGTEIAARLMGVAGGLMNLSKMPACNVQVCSAAHSLKP